MQAMAGGRPGRPAALLERDAEIAELGAAAAGARRGHGSVAVIEGEAGIGKSSVIKAFLAGLPSDVGSLVGGCDDLLAPRALGPLHEAVRGIPGPLADALGGPVEQLYDAAVAQLSARPTVLVVEDVHWADDATLDLLRHLARRIDALPAVLVLSLRDEELLTGNPAQALLGVLATAPRVRHLRLAPLSPAAVDTLASAAGRDGAALHRVIGGNPFYVTETLAAPPGALPDSVADAVRARLRVLDSTCVEALEQLAVVPTVVDPLLAKALLGERVDALAAAEERGIIEVRPGGLAFRHELARRAVEAGLPGLRRRALHLAVVRALRELGAADAERLVHHAAAAGDAATIVEFAPAAAAAAAAGGSHTQALAHLETAVGHAVLLDPPARAAAGRPRLAALHRAALRRRGCRGPGRRAGLRRGRVGRPGDRGDRPALPVPAHVRRHRRGGGGGAARGHRGGRRARCPGDAGLAGRAPRRDAAAHRPVRGGPSGARGGDRAGRGH
jgi:AAA ATPase domain